MENVIGMKIGDYEVVEYVGRLNPKRTDRYYKLKCTIHGEENTSLDRVDVNGNYTKANLRWATQEVQNRNTRKQLKTCTAIDKYGNKYEFNCAKEFAETHNMNATYIYNVLNGRQKTYNGWIFYRN